MPRFDCVVAERAHDVDRALFEREPCVVARDGDLHAGTICGDIEIDQRLGSRPSPIRPVARVASGDATVTDLAKPFDFSRGLEAAALGEVTTYLE